ncbi:MAG: hypothetical protein MET45_04455 [Nostoc sp. LLA-1]|nr:hypothetical protein [Cyanocohniella sp. LLY]
MKDIDFIPFGVSAIKLAFNCSKCGYPVMSDELDVPYPDYTAETAHDSESDNGGEYVYCSECSQEYEICIYSSYVGGNITVEGLDHNTNVEVIEISDSYDEEYELNAILSNTDFYGKFREDISNLRYLNNLDIPIEAILKILKRQIYIGAITCLETYLLDAFFNTIMTNKDLYIRKFVETFKVFEDRKISKSCVFEYVNNKAETEVINEIKEIIYHNLSKVSNMYKETFVINFPNFGEIARAINIRHDLVHRNGKTKDDKLHDIDKKHINDLLDKIEKFVDKIQIELNNIEVDNF